MTARSKKRRMKNSRIKREVNKVKELKRLRKTVAGKNAVELMDVVGDVVEEKTLEELKKVSERADGIWDGFLEFLQQ